MLALLIRAGLDRTGRVRRSRRRHPSQAQDRIAHARERPAGRARAGHVAAGRQRPGVVSRRLEGRAQRAHRVRPSLRAHDVPRLGERRPRGAHALRARGRRHRQRLRPTSIARSTGRRCPSNHLERVLWLEADRMASLVVNEENFKKEREVVKEERRLRFENPPYGMLGRVGARRGVHDLSLQVPADRIDGRPERGDGRRT